MRDTIALLDGVNPSGSGGANYSGGSDYYQGAPLYPSSEGLAGGHGLSDYLDAFSRSSFVMSPTGSNGANNEGGSDWYPGATTYINGEGGLSSMHGGYEVQRMPRTMNPSGSGGANYSGGSDWYPGAPTYPSSEGLARGPRSAAIRASLRTAIAGGASKLGAVQLGRWIMNTMSQAAGMSECAAAAAAAYKTARAMGYDEAWARDKARLEVQACDTFNYRRYATKA